MKKLIVTFISLCIIICTCLPVYATSDYTDVGDRILNIEKRYFADHNAESREELTAEQINELSLLIQSEKNKIFNDKPSMSNNARVYDYTGGIFLQFDSGSNSSSLGWDHGHAAIGYGNGTVEILGPNHTVKLYGSSRVDQWYEYSQTGGYYTVRGATDTDNSNAANNALGKVGSRYYVIGTMDFSGYTCSGLVATSWTEAGVNLGGKWTTPAGLESNANTVLQWSWADV